jgi:hypothetical protein
MLAQALLQKSPRCIVVNRRGNGHNRRETVDWHEPVLIQFVKFTWLPKETAIVFTNYFRTG